MLKQRLSEMGWADAAFGVRHKLPGPWIHLESLLDIVLAFAPGLRRGLETHTVIARL